MMLSAVKAKEIYDEAVKTHRLAVRQAIEEEADGICDEIRESAGKRHTSMKINPKYLNNPTGVIAYLEDELGYECSRCNDGQILIRWAPAA